MTKNWDFTLKKYEEICEAISASHCKNMTISKYLENREASDPIILLRHDIDENSIFAADMAKVEAEHGIVATYYFRTKKKVYVPSIIDSIASYGHEIGYHYETLDMARGDIDLAIRLFSNDLAKFREKYEIKTVCMHGNPLSRFDNRSIWKKCRLDDFALLGEPYLSLDYNRFAYFSDSGRTWDINRNKVKDTISKVHHFAEVHTTDDLIRLIKNGNLHDIIILTHPERWPRTKRDYYYRYYVDLTYNLGKWVLARTRGRKKRNEGSS